MTDTELLQHLDLSIPAAAEVIGISRQVLYRALNPQNAVTNRRGVAKSNDSSTSHYLNADRLLALWRHYVDKGDARAANQIRDVVIERHPGVGEMISPYTEKVESPEQYSFTECWVFSREPFEINYPEFRASMKAHLQANDRRQIYFVPSEDVASKLLANLKVASDGKLKQVYIITTPAVSLCPHWFAIFDFQVNRGETYKLFTGVMPEPPEGKEIWEQAVRVPEIYFRNARDILMEEGLLDARDRFKPSKEKEIPCDKQSPGFHQYYPKSEVSK